MLSYSSILLAYRLVMDVTHVKQNCHVSRFLIETINIDVGKRSIRARGGQESIEHTIKILWTITSNNGNWKTSNFTTRLRGKERKMMLYFFIFTYQSHSFVDSRWFRTVTQVLISFIFGAKHSPPLIGRSIWPHTLDSYNQSHKINTIFYFSYSVLLHH